MERKSDWFGVMEVFKINKKIEKYLDYRKQYTHRYTYLDKPLQSSGAFGCLAVVVIVRKKDWVHLEWEKKEVSGEEMW